MERRLPQSQLRERARIHDEVVNLHDAEVVELQPQASSDSA
jgi:hypothetical protein